MSDGQANEGFDLLAWDSERFGFLVARLHRSVSRQSLEAQVQRMRDIGVVLAYYSVDEAAPPLSTADAARFGATLVDTRVTFSLRLESAPTDPVPSVRALAAAEFQVRSFRHEPLNPELIALARDSGRFSRFRTDPRIAPRVFFEIYDAWLVRSVRREIADEVFVASDGDRDVGLITISESGASATIGLLSVSDAVRGRGLGRLLTRKAFDWASTRGCTHGIVSTQLANRAACRMYEAAGCSVLRRERVYHFWLS